MNLGDLVIRKSYGGDVTFRVDNILQNRAVIKGTEFRLLADSPLEDLVQVPPTRVTERGARAQIKATESLSWLRKDRQIQSQRSGESVSGSTGTWGPSPKEAAYFEVPGKVLHLDGDALYLKKSLSLYEQLRIPAEGHHVNESKMAETLYRLLPRVRPDIVVITGHDGVLKQQQNYDLYSLSSYKNSQNFVAAIRVAREYERNFDALTIVAGACQSHFEALLGQWCQFRQLPGQNTHSCSGPGVYRGQGLFYLHPGYGELKRCTEPYDQRQSGDGRNRDAGQLPDRNAPAPEPGYAEGCTFRAVTGQAITEQVEGIG